MSEAIDLQELSVRESEQTEWKENVADIDVTDLVKQVTPYAGTITQWFVGTVTVTVLLLFPDPIPGPRSLPQYLGRLLLLGPARQHYPPALASTCNRAPSLPLYTIGQTA